VTDPVPPPAGNGRAPASLLIVTGMSGGGKSVALNTFEDLGFYCVDNLPAELLPEFVRTATHPERAEQKLAVGIDMRNRGDLAKLPEWLSAVGAMGLQPQLVFFDASDESLLRRYADTRRRHPLTHLGLALADAIALERQALALDLDLLAFERELAQRGCSRLAPGCVGGARPRVVLCHGASPSGARPG